MLNRRAFFVLGFVLAACGGDASTAPNSIAGTWTLQSINGAALPYTFPQSGSNKTELVSDVITLSSGGTFTESMTYRTTANGTTTSQSIPESGNYSVNGETLILHFPSDGSTGIGTWSGDRVTIGTQGYDFVYTR